jgi:hypothetical protein
MDLSNLQFLLTKHSMLWTTAEGCTMELGMKSIGGPIPPSKNLKVNLNALLMSIPSMKSQIMKANVHQLMEW